MSRSCVCGGANENCRFCGGLGTIPDTLASALSGRLHEIELEESFKEASKVRHPLTSHRPPSALMTPRLAAKLRKRGASVPHNKVLCPQLCGAWIRFGRVDRHLRKVHGIMPPVHQQVERPLIRYAMATNPARRYEECAICKATVRVDRLAKHMRKVHKNGASAPILATKSMVAVPSSPKPQVAQTTYQFCSVCKAKIRTARMSLHMAKAHRTQRTRSSKVVVRSSKDVHRQATTLVAPRDKNLDATKLYAHSYREQGRFGSHPSHDGFSDESGPE